GYLKTTLGEADDVADADGDRFLDFRQAQGRARSWFGVAGGAGKHAAFTVGDALDEYMETFRGKSVTATRSRIDAIIKPELGDVLVSELSSKVIADWHHRRASSAARLRTGKRAEQPNF